MGVTVLVGLILEVLIGAAVVAVLVKAAKRIIQLIIGERRF